MTSLRIIRKRLHSIGSIEQLTKAMEMIAASHLHQAVLRMKHTLFYLDRLQQVFYPLYPALKEFTLPLLEPKKGKTGRIGLVILGADMGLCGSYNKDLFAATQKFLKQWTLNRVELILVGKKVLSYYHSKEWKVRQTFPEMEKMTTALETKKLTDELVRGFLVDGLDEIWVIYTHYAGVFSKQVRTEKLLPIDPPPSLPKTALANEIFEPSPLAVYEEILRHYCLAKVQSFLQQAYAAELAARVFAMKTATSNANEMIEKLTLVRNKIRQGEITKEMLEIISGAELLK